MKYMFRARPRRLKFGYKMICFIIIGVIVFLLVDAKIKPIVRSLAESQAKNTLTRLTSDVVNEIMQDENLSYGSLVAVEKNESGEITSVQSDISKMNMLKAEISTKISERIDSLDKQKMKIPLGTVIGSDLLSGRGPNIKVYFSLSGDVTTDIVNNFDSAGINQTRHQILLDITTDIYIVLPGDKTGTQQKTNIIIAETVIVGGVPSTYADITNKDNGITQK